MRDFLCSLANTCLVHSCLLVSIYLGDVIEDITRTPDSKVLTVNSRRVPHPSFAFFAKEGGDFDSYKPQKPEEKSSSRRAWTRHGHRRRRNIERIAARAEYPTFPYADHTRWVHKVQNSNRA
jgi:hypothetical protein